MKETPPSVVGLSPWLPWPLSHWPWWTTPVRAERLALLRIGVAVCLLADIGLNYAPATLTCFAKDSLGDRAIFDERVGTQHMTWSLLRGVGDTTIRFLCIGIILVTTGWIIGTSLAGILAGRKQKPPDDSSGIARWLWTVAFIVYVTGLWSELLNANGEDVVLAWFVPLIGVSAAVLFCGLDLVWFLHDRTHRILWLPHAGALSATLALFVVGYWFLPGDDVDKTAWWFRLLQPWQDDATLLIAAMGLWIASAFLLLIGCATRFAAILCWSLSLSFANVNPHLDNAGDTIRHILLFYLMLCPCGAVWSIDTLRQKKDEPTFVHPWAIRLLFVQLIFIYFMNGLYKLNGSTWLEGSSLHYVLGDLSFARFSALAVPLPYELTRALTWAVLAWEVSFPLLVLWKWPRRAALLFGVLFHLGIFATMDLAGFVPYVLCMYLPLIPVKESEPEV